MNPRFRVAEESDAPLLLQFMRQYYTFDGHAFDELKAPTALLNFLRDPSLGLAWLIFDQQPDQEIPVGYIVLTLGYSLEFLGRDAFIDEFFLIESHRSRGWGRKTMEFVEDYARSLGIRAIHLEVVRANRSAFEVYRKLGFSDRQHHLMTKRIQPGFAKPGS
jgi:diamine N-acetyltransferase